MPFSRTPCILAAGIGLTLSSGVHAEEGPVRLSGTADIVLENTLTTGPDAAIDDLVLEIDADLKLSVTDRINITTDIVLEQIDGVEQSGFYVARGEGIGLDTLLINFDAAHGSVFAGRFEPNVYDDAFAFLPDLWPTDLLEDQLEITGAAGFGGFVEYSNGALGTHRLEGSLFTADRSVLGRTLITDRGRTRAGDGGVGNTGRPESFVLAVHGGGVPGLDGVSYHLGVTGLMAGLILDDAGTAVADTADEYRVRMAVRKEHELPSGLTLTGAADYAHVWNAAGFNGARRDYLTGLLKLEDGPRAFGIAATGLWVHEADGESRDEYNVKIGYSHELPSDLTFDASVSVFERQGEVTTETVLSLTKTIGFGRD